MSVNSTVTALQHVVFFVSLLAKRAVGTLPLAMAAFLLVPNAWAGPADDPYTDRPCIQVMKRASDHVVISHNPSCDLREVARMFPLVNAETGKPLPMQVQLRSLYAANQTRTVDGKKIRYTVLRGCVRPGKPSADADQDELNACRDGLMNYFSAPDRDSTAILTVPFTPKLTYAARMEQLSRSSCAILSKIKQPDAEQQSALADCAKEFPDAIVKPPKTDVPDRDTKSTVDSPPASSAKGEAAQPIDGSASADTESMSGRTAVGGSDDGMFRIDRFKMYLAIFFIVLFAFLVGVRYERFRREREEKAARRKDTLPPGAKDLDVVALQRVVKERDTRIKLLRKQMGDDQEKIRQMSEDAASMRVMDSDRARKLNAYDDMERKCRESEAEQEKIKLEAAGIKLEAEQLVEKIKADLQNAEAVNASLRNWNETLSAEKTGLESENARLKAEADKCRQDANDWCAESTDSLAKFTQERNRTVALELELASERGAHAAYSYLEKEIPALRSEIALKDGKIEELEKRVTSYFEALTGLSTPSSVKPPDAPFASSSAKNFGPPADASIPVVEESVLAEDIPPSPPTQPGLGLLAKELSENEQGIVDALMREPDDQSGAVDRLVGEMKRSGTPHPPVDLNELQRSSYSALVSKRIPSEGSLEDEFPTAVQGRKALKPPLNPSSSPLELTQILEALKDPGLFQDVIRGLAGEDFLSALKFKLVALSQADVMRTLKTLAQEVLLRRYAGASPEGDVSNKEDVFAWHALANLRLVCADGYRLQKDGFPLPPADMRVCHFAPHSFSRLAGEESDSKHVNTITPGNGQVGQDPGS